MKEDRDAFARLMDLESEVRNASNGQLLHLVLVNRTRSLLPHRQAFLFKEKTHRCLAVSDLPKVDGNSPMVQWVQDLVRGISPEKRQTCHALSWDDVSPENQKSWSEYAPETLIWLPLKGTRLGEMGGMLFAFDSPPKKNDMVLLEHLGETFGHALQVFRSPKPFAGLKARPPGKLKLALLALVVLLLCSRVHLTRMAPAEIVPRNPIQVTAPLDGVVKGIEVAANETVEKGDLLARMEDRTWRHEYTMALKALAVARAEYQRAERSAFKDTDSQNLLAELKAQVASRQAQATQAKDRLDRTQIRATARGTAMVPRPEYWKGRPVRTGESLLEIADPQQVEVQILLPVKDALLMKARNRVRLFLDADPLAPLEARFHHAQYRAEPVPQGHYAYRLTARLAPDTTPPRMGLRGTAKLYGPKVSLFYFLFHRPLTWLRQNTGL